ncbi:MAG TPA: NYN domain-containing protein [Rectinemataceae bacterium]|nr:NYN domain-containing protein [Rectinemataceae bacterium]
MKNSRSVQVQVPTETGHQVQLKLAVLVDADNTQATIVEGLLAEIAKYGIASVKRIYGDWTSTNLRSWKDKLLEYAIQPVQQFAYTSGKNATDSAMIIDAMDLLYTENLDGFCVVSSDSDFTRLAARLREDGKLVLGFGQKKTPKPFVAACDKFIYTEILREGDDEAHAGKEPKRDGAQDLKGDKKVATLLRAAVEDAADEFGWAYLGAVGTYIANRQPEFDPRNYGYRKLGDLIKSSGLFEIDERDNPYNPGKQVYMRAIQKSGRR